MMNEILDDIKLVLSKTENIDNLFGKIDELLKMQFNGDFEIRNLISSLSILGDKELARIIIFFLRNAQNADYFDSLRKENVDTQFVDNIQFLAAKYTHLLDKELKKRQSPLSWNSIQTKGIIDVTPELELKIFRNDGEILILHEDPSSLVNLLKVVLEELLEITPYIDDEEEESLYDELGELFEVMKKFVDDDSEIDSNNV